MERPAAFLLRAAQTAFRLERSRDRGVNASRNTKGYTSGALKNISCAQNMKYISGVLKIQTHLRSPKSTGHISGAQNMKYLSGALKYKTHHRSKKYEIPLRGPKIQDTSQEYKI
jgi:hypothetical protein